MSDSTKNPALLKASLRSGFQTKRLVEELVGGWFDDFYGQGDTKFSIKQEDLQNYVFMGLADTFLLKRESMPGIILEHIAGVVTGVSDISNLPTNNNDFTVYLIDEIENNNFFHTKESNIRKGDLGLVNAGIFYKRNLNQSNTAANRASKRTIGIDYHRQTGKQGFLSASTMAMEPERTKLRLMGQEFSFIESGLQEFSDSYLFGTSGRQVDAKSTELGINFSLYGQLPKISE